MRPGRPRIAASVTVCRPVAHSSCADLKQQIAFARVLLDDAIAVAGNPDIVLVIDEAAVDAVRQDRRLTPCIHYVTVAIVLDNRRGRDRDDCLWRDQTVIVTAVHGENVVVRVDAGSGDLTRHPGLAGCRIDGERFRPERINDVSRN